VKNARRPARGQADLEQPQGAPDAGERLMADRLLAAFEHLDEAVVLTDAQDRIVLTNRHFRRVHADIAEHLQPGRSYEAFLRARVTAGDAVEAARDAEAWIAARMARRRNPAGSEERQLDDGRWIQVRDQRLPDGGTITMRLDITERKRAQTEATLRSRDLQLIVDSVPVMITRLDREERFLFANRPYLELMELSAEDILGRRIADVIAPGAYAQVKPALDRALAGDPVSVERVQHRANGAPVELEGRYIPDVDVAGRVIGLIAVHRDVTAERRAQRSLAESEARFRGLTELSSDWYWEQDEQFRYTYISEDAAARGALGMQARAGKTRWEVPWTGVSEAQWAAHRAQLEAHQVFHDFELGRPGPDGETVWVSVSGAPIFDAGGRFKGYRGVTRNITARKSAAMLLRLEHRAMRALADGEDAASGLRSLLQAVCESANMGCGRYFSVDESAGVMRFQDGWSLPAHQRYLDESRTLVFRPGAGLAGIAWQTGEPVWSSDTSRDPRVLAKSLAQDHAIRGAFAFPVTAQGKVIGVVSFSGVSVRRPEERILEAARIIGSQIGQFLQRKQAEERLRASEERFRQTFEHAASGIAHVDLQGRFTRVNRSLCRILGRAANELVGRTVREFSHAEDLSVTDAARQRMLAGEIESEHFEKRYLRKDGTVVWVDLTVALVRNTDGAPEYEVAVFDDITERKRADQALAAGEALKGAMLASALDSIVSFDGDGRIIEFNPAAERCFGWSRADALGRPVIDLLLPAEVRDRRRGELDMLAHTDAAPLHGRRVEMTALRRDGSRITIEIAVARLPNVAPPVFTAFLRDITGSKRALDALAESEARFRAIFERASAGMAITDAGGLYLSVNAAFARFFGYALEEIVGKLKVSDLRSADDAEGPELYRRLVAGEIAFFERDRPYRRKDGAQIWGRATVSAVREPGGQAPYIVAVFSDITEEVLARERVERMNAELEERVETRTAELRAAMKELDAFTYSVSHDLRAPVGAVSGFAHLLRSAESARLSEDGRRLIDFIEHNAERMTRLIEGLLRFARLGRSDLRRTRVSMNGLAAESLLDFVDEAARARVSAAAMPECHGDPALLGQVWSNLIGNALKYSRGAEAPRIDIGWDAGRCAYYVRDNGVGFDMAYAGKLFGVFERLHAESEFEGSGIGLAIAERIVKLHGGAIWADAASGRGATFWFTVPPGGAASEPRSSPQARR
jgi:PAS domain S-box-containing protein